MTNSFLVLVAILSAVPSALPQTTPKARASPKTFSSDSAIKERFPTPFLQAIVRGHTWLVQVMLEKGEPANVKYPAKQDHVPLLVAVIAQKRDVVRMLIRYGADVEAVDENGFSALTLACALKDAELVDILLRSGANVDGSASLAEITPLMAATNQGSLTITNRLLKAGADINGRTRMNSANALMAAADDAKLIEYLISKGADVNASDHRGWTPLFYAIEQNQLAKAEALLLRGARTDMTDKTGMSAARLAEKHSDAELRRSMLSLLERFQR